LAGATVFALGLAAKCLTGVVAFLANAFGSYTACFTGLAGAYRASCYVARFAAFVCISTFAFSRASTFSRASIVA